MSLRCHRRIITDEEHLISTGAFVSLEEELFIMLTAAREATDDSRPDIEPRETLVAKLPRETRAFFGEGKSTGLPWTQKFRETLAVRFLSTVGHRLSMLESLRLLTEQA